MKKKTIFGFLCYSTFKNLSIHVSFITVGLAVKIVPMLVANISPTLAANVYGFCNKHFTRGTDSHSYGQTDGRTDTVSESSYGNMSAHEKFQLKAQN